MSESADAPPTSFQERFAHTSPAVIIGAAVVAVIVAAIAGFGIGVKVESGHKSTAKKTGAAAAAAKKKAQQQKAAKAKPVSVVGKVESANGTTLTVRTSKGATQKITISKATVVQKASKGASGDVTKGSRVLFKPKNFTTAQEVIVLPPTSKVGKPLTAVASTSMTYKGAKGKAVTITTTGATVDKTAAAKATDLTKDGAVIVITRRGAKGLVAAEIILLPAGSAFV